FKKHQIKYFRNFHTYAIDSCGFGKSISKNNEYSIEQYSENAINFCKKLGIKETYVIGFSDGGNICLFLAKKAPEIFTKIIAISPNYLASGLTEGTLKLQNKIHKAFLFFKKIIKNS
ncbi:MAG: alpha/beta hydrolase, partial [Clostridiales bacterium]|nr:alpha/beta hydrolase [Clostridiales bacterium]